ncbi:hypothetical protein J4450_01935 [Candidatus Micrarchaeota archaeon]|nr:hypothetical protein [Candidatus Micrarchaeota archaeon]
MGSALLKLRGEPVQLPARRPILHVEKGVLNEGPIDGIPMGIIKLLQLIRSGGNIPGISDPELYTRLVDNWCRNNNRTIADVEAAEAKYWQNQQNARP